MLAHKRDCILRIHPLPRVMRLSLSSRRYITTNSTRITISCKSIARRNCSKKLQDAYPYDTDGIAYATWLFRSGQQDSKPGADDKTIMLEVKADGDWFIYTALDMGWEFSNRIKITNKGDKTIIEDICAVKN